jgi:hypothetical protein
MVNDDFGFAAGDCSREEHGGGTEANQGKVFHVISTDFRNGAMLVASGSKESEKYGRRTRQPTFQFRLGKQEIESSLAAVQRLRDRRAALLEEIQEIDRSLEGMQRQIVEILGAAPVAAPQTFAPRASDKKIPKREPELTVNAAVLEVILAAGDEISKSDIRIQSMKPAGAFSESALNAALMYSVDQGKIENTSRGYYAAVRQ